MLLKVLQNYSKYKNKPNKCYMFYNIAKFYIANAKITIDIPAMLRILV